MTEFLLQQKPAITFKNKSPKTYMLNVVDVSDLEETCRHALKPPKSLMRNICNFIKDEHPYFDGNSSERVIASIHEYFECKQSEKLKSKPLNLLRKIKLRRKLKYFKINDFLC